MMNKRIRLSRLIRLRDVVLKNIPPDRLANMSESDAVFETIAFDLSTSRCFTTRGLGAWAAVDRAFRRQGLTIFREDGQNPGLGWVRYRRKWAHHALAGFFGLTRDECHQLFTLVVFPQYIKRQLRARLSRLIERHQKA